MLQTSHLQELKQRYASMYIQQEDTEEVEVAEGIRDFKVGDTVKFVNDDSDYWGQTGKITSLSGNGISQKATVKLDKGGKSVTNVLVKVDLIKEEVAEGWKKGKYTIKDENGKILGTYSSGGKAKKVMDDLMQKGDYPELTVSMVEEVEVDEKKMPADAKRKQQARRKKQKAMGKKAPDAVYARGYAKRKKQTGHGAKDPKKGRIQGMKAQAGSFVPDGSVIERWKNSAFDKVRAIRSKLKETNDIAAARELKMYIDNDQQLYKSQLVPIVKNIQRKMKSGKYDHRKAPKLWSYLVDNGAKKYVKEFGGTVKSVFPKDVRDSVAIEFANEYRSEIESQNGEMF